MKVEHIMNNDLKVVSEKLKVYIKLILNEYGTYMSDEIKERLANNQVDLVRFGDSQTISFVVSNGILNLPRCAYAIFAQLEKNPNYGIRTKVYDVAKYMDTNTTYIGYINEVIECGLSPLDYFLESLLHETMHICGSTGGNPLDEGINEMVTRRLAQKYNLSIAAMGYPKEVEVARTLEKVIGEELIGWLTFIPEQEKKQFISVQLGEDIAKMYERIKKMMDEKTNSELLMTSDPFTKATIYDQISYREELALLNLLSPINNKEYK